MCIKWICIFYIVLRFFVNDTATTEISTYCHSLSLHDALPISLDYSSWDAATLADFNKQNAFAGMRPEVRSEEHTSELQSLMRISSAVFCSKKKPITHIQI